MVASTVAGMVTLGPEFQNMALSNGQAFSFNWYLPTYKPAELKLTIVKSENHNSVIPTDEQMRNTLMANIVSRYRLGWDFEPQRYFTQVDAPWAASILLEYNIGGDWESEVYTADFKDLFTFNLEDITVIIT